MAGYSLAGYHGACSVLYLGSGRWQGVQGLVPSSGGHGTKAAGRASQKGAPFVVLPQGAGDQKLPEVFGGEGRAPTWTEMWGSSPGSSISVPSFLHSMDAMG